MFHFYSLNRDEYMTHYHQRSNAESGFSMIKAKFRDSVRSRTDTAMKNEALCKFICHNICCVIMSQLELGVEPVFWGKQPKEAAPIPATPTPEPAVVESPIPPAETSIPHNFQGCVGA